MARNLDVEISSRTKGLNQLCDKSQAAAVVCDVVEDAQFGGVGAASHPRRDYSRNVRGDARGVFAVPAWRVEWDAKRNHSKGAPMTQEQPPFIPVAVPDLGGREEEYVVQAVRSSWISSSGEFLDRVEVELAELSATSTAIAVCNGTAALHLAMLALDVGHGDEVLVPSLTYIATANAVRYVGAEPVFVDIDLETWCIDPDALEASITPRTRGIIAVHLYGHPADMDHINRVAAEHGLWVVEDAAEAHLATYKGRPVGGLATLATFSFYGNKMFTSGEGGA